MSFRIYYDAEFSKIRKTDYIKYDWYNNIKEAEENLKRLKEHYEYFKRISSYKDEFALRGAFEEIKEKDWYCYKKYSLYLLKKGKIFEFVPPWIHGDTLYKIWIQEDIDGRQYTFN